MQQKRASRVLRNVAAMLLGQMTTTVLSLLVTIYVPRNVGPTVVGELAIGTILTSLLTNFMAMGVSTVIIRDVARDHAKAADLIGAALVIKMLTALPYLFLVAAIGWLVGYSPTTQTVIAITSVGVILAMLTEPFQSGFQAFERMKYNSLTGVIAEFIVVIGSVTVVVAGKGAIWLSTITIISGLVTLFLSIRWWRSLGSVNLRFNFKLMRYLLTRGFPFWASGLFTSVYLLVDSFMLSVIATDEVVGWYNVPTVLFGFLLFVPTTVGMAIFPALARAYKHAPREMVKLARRSFNLITCLSLPIAVGGGLLSKQIILTLYGLKFGPSIPIMTVLSAMAVPMYINIQVYQFLAAAERQVIWTKVMAVACVLNPLMNLFLINYYQVHHQNGAYGAAWAMFLSEGLMAVVGIVLLPRGILGWENIVSIVKSAAAAGFMALAVWYTQGYFIAIPIVTGIVVYAGAVFLLGVLPREELELLQMIGTKILSKFGRRRTMPQADAKVI